jgi:hypothetical protein
VETGAREIPDPEIWVLMVSGGWFQLEVGGRGKMEECGRGDEGGKFWGMKNVQTKKMMCNATFWCGEFFFFLKVRIFHSTGNDTNMKARGGFPNNNPNLKKSSTNVKSNKVTKREW